MGFYPYFPPMAKVRWYRELFRQIKTSSNFLNCLCKRFVNCCKLPWHFK